MKIAIFINKLSEPDSKGLLMKDWRVDNRDFALKVFSETKICELN